MSDEKDKKLSVSEREEQVLAFWEENKIFEKSIEKPAGNDPTGNYIFYDGPPFATGLPHYGHILPNTIKDVIPRYQTMKGKRSPRRWGWDCHGLPVENLVEKELGLETKKDIEDYGIEKFNEAAQKSVLKYADEWKKIIPRLGRWVDMEKDYRTMDWKYTESVWWVFKSLYDKGLIYEGHKAMHICPRCETTLANFEVGQGYKDIKDISVTVKFKLDPGQKINNFETDDNTYILAWTTTPWTLPGNVALAVNPNVEYRAIKTKNLLLGKEEIFIFAKDRIKDVFKVEQAGREEFNLGEGLSLVGLKYEPIFPYYDNDKLENREHSWKIYSADFVNTDDGTGVVHIAPAFGEDDMILGQKENLPFIQHVGMDGKFKQEVVDFAGLSVKPKEDHQSTDIEIIKWLANKNRLFDKEKISHPYPYCWRCDTPLLNYATSSWFVKVTELKDKLIKNNKKINWIPSHIRDGRFGKWLEGARDWAISRSRFWGAPFPVWKCDKCKSVTVFSSVDDMKAYAKQHAGSDNRYFVMRHGESSCNVEKTVSSKKENPHHLTEKGKREIEEAVKMLKDEKIEIIFASSFARAKETAELVASKLGLEKDKIIFDDRLLEVNTGIFNGKKNEEYHAHFSSLEEKFYKTPPEGENLTQLKNRVTEFLYETEENYSSASILIISHEYPIWNLFAGTQGANVKESVQMKEEMDVKKDFDFIKTGEVMKLDFVPLPHNKNFELDLHRPYIDEIKFKCLNYDQVDPSSKNSCDGEIRRIPDVFDCWFESGSMPYGQAHYPFESKEEFEKNFPAEFIAEGLDQTRGWFYNLLVLSTALFDKPAYNNVIVNGIILAEDGQKMSKRLKNYPDPMEIVSKYGADALRYYLLSSSAVRADSLNFSEKGVDEVYKKVILRLRNVVSFYEMYVDKARSTKYEARNKNRKTKSENILDRWILARLNELTNQVTKTMDNYELDKAVRPIGDFVEDLSTWYIRRSRERFKSEDVKDKENAIATTQFVLERLSKIIAPFMPFLAEEIFQTLHPTPYTLNASSVHLEDWPKKKKLSESQSNLLAQMEEVRRIVSLGLEARADGGVKVRQPLRELRIKLNPNDPGKTNALDEIDNHEDEEQLFKLIKDELNIKEIMFTQYIKNEIELNTELTPELIQEGNVRDLTRAIQDLRKKKNFSPTQKLAFTIEASDEGKNLVNQHVDDFKKSIGAESINFEEVSRGESIKIGELNFKIKIK